MEDNKNDFLYLKSMFLVDDTNYFHLNEIFVEYLLLIELIDNYLSLYLHIEIQQKVKKQLLNIESIFFRFELSINLY